MNKRKLYMCSLCGRVWHRDELELGQNEALLGYGRGALTNYSNRLKGCPRCHAPLYTAQFTRQLLKEMWLEDLVDIDDLKQIGVEWRRKWLLKYRHEHRSEYEDEGEDSL